MIENIIMFGLAGAVLGFYSSQKIRQARDEGIREMGALMGKLRDDCPADSYAREAYDFVIDDLNKLALSGSTER